MKVGDVVVPKTGAYNTTWTQGQTFVLHCGSGVYNHAIVARLEPFTLISESGDMMWTATVKPEYFTVLCQASAEIIERVMQRLNSGR